jgi:organic radical activating enzyme
MNPPRTVTLILNDRCPLRCRHCSIGFSKERPGSAGTMDPNKLAGLITTLDPKLYDMVILAGGEPALVPDLVTTAVDACRAAGIASALTTAPYWARKRASAQAFLDRITRPDFIILSLDKYHLEFLKIADYETAADEAIKRNVCVAVNICYANTADRDELTAAIGSFAHRLVILNYSRIMPKGNARQLPELLSESVNVSQPEDLDRIPRSCLIGNVVVNRNFDLHACCWSGDIEDSPLFMAADATHSSVLATVDGNPRYQRVRRHGLLDGLDPAQKTRLFERVRGSQFVDECHLCMSLMEQRDWIPIFEGGSRAGDSPRSPESSFVPVELLQRVRPVLAMHPAPFAMAEENRHV